MKYRIVLLESIADEAMKMLDTAEDCEIFNVGAAYDEDEIDAVITRGKGQVDSKFLDSLPQLKAVARCGVGLDNVDVNHAAKLHVQVLNVPGVNSDTIAEHTLGLMLMLQRKLYISTVEVKAGNWEYRKIYDGDEIRGKTLGILGMGNIGQKVGKLAKCFGMTVQYSNMFEVDSEFAFKTKEEVISTSDIISVHLPLTPETEKMLDASAFRSMRMGSLLINTARGGVIDEKALIYALKSGQLGGYAADVLSFEPPDNDHPLLTLDNALITPHAGSLTKRTYDEMCILSVRNVLDLLLGKKVDDKFKANTI